MRSESSCSKVGTPFHPLTHSLTLDRFTQIERENRMLLEKMTLIMAQRPCSAAPARAPRRSLNKEARKQQLLQITMQNQAIFKRLQDKQSSYNVAQWESEHRVRIKRAKNISEFPYSLRASSRSLNSSAALRDRPGSVPGFDSSFSQRDRSLRKPAAIRQAEKLDENRVMLYRKGKQLGPAGYFIVEISSSPA